MTTFLLVRHALTDWVGRGLSGRLPGIPLSAAGRAQAADLGERLRDLRLDAVYSSPLDRAVQTAQEVARPHGLAVQAREGLNEVDFGEWTGMTFDDLAADGRWKTFNTHRATAAVPGGEAMSRVMARVASELRVLAARHPAGRVVAVSHCDVIRAALLHHLGMSGDHYARLAAAPASVAVLELGGSGARLLRLNDTGRLAETA
jgi:probable phosphomutase (TIGR03848 family)